MKKLQMILFNIIETLFIFSIGYLITDIIPMVIISMLFFIPRMVFNGTSHYKSPIKCFIVSTLLALSMFMMYTVDPILGYVSAVFAGVILTEKGDIKNLYQWNNGEESIHQILIDYLKFNALNNDYIETENLLKEKVDTMTYLIYKRKFIDGLSYEKISNELDISNPRIKEALDKCYYFIIGRLNL